MRQSNNILWRITLRLLGGGPVGSKNVGAGSRYGGPGVGGGGGVSDNYANEKMADGTGGGIYSSTGTGGPGGAEGVYGSRNKAGETVLLKLVQQNYIHTSMREGENTQKSGWDSCTFMGKSLFGFLKKGISEW